MTEQEREELVSGIKTDAGKARMANVLPSVREPSLEGQGPSPCSLSVNKGVEPSAPARAIMEGKDPIHETPEPYSTCPTPGCGTVIKRGQGCPKCRVLPE